MEKQIKMPKLRPEMESGVVCAWLKEEGQQVLAGEPLYEIETDKVVSQIEATAFMIVFKRLTLNLTFAAISSAVKVQFV